MGVVRVGWDGFNRLMVGQQGGSVMVVMVGLVLLGLMVVQVGWVQVGCSWVMAVVVVLVGAAKQCCWCGWCGC